MEHADTAQLAAVGGALGSVLVLLARGRAARPLLLVGLAAPGRRAELALAWALGGGLLDRLSGADRRAAAGRRRGGGARRGGRPRPLARGRAAGRARGRAASAAALLRQLEHASSSRSPTTAASAGCCRSTSCSRRRPPRSAGARCAADELRAAAEDDRAPGRRVLRVRLLLAPVGRRRGGRHEPAARSSRCRSPLCWPRSARARLPGLGAARAGGHRARAGLAVRGGRASGRPPPTSCSSTRPTSPASNANTDYFRVTSLFGDPSLYGRHVVLGIGVALTLLATRRWRTWPLIALIVLMWAGLLFSYSQSSMIALLVVTLALAAGDRRRRVRRGVALLAAAALARRVRLRRRAGGDGEVLEQDHQRPHRARAGRDARDRAPSRSWAWASAGSRAPAAGWRTATGRRRTSSRTPRRSRCSPSWASSGSRCTRGCSWAARDPDLAGDPARPGARARARSAPARAVRARALLQRLPRGPAHVARARRWRRPYSVEPLAAERRPEVAAA